MIEMEEPGFEDKRHLAAAEGWLELGNCREASAALEGVSARFRNRPEVLRVRHGIYAATKKWEEAARIAHALSLSDPESPFGWLHHAFALHELKQTHDALKVLLPAAARFRQDPLIPYNLACYSCQLGDLKGALKWLTRAIKLGRRDDIRHLALEDPDLEPLWPKIGEI